MLPKKYVVFLVALLILAFAAISVNSAFGAGFDKVPGQHPPICYRIEWFAPGVWGLECYDEGKDIVNVALMTNLKYELTWNEESVVLYVYPTGKYSVAYWSVMDKDGSIISGVLQ